MKQLKLFKKEKLYQNWDWLYNEYITLDKNTVLIGREQKTTHKVILYWLQKFNIKKDSPLYQDRDWLNNEYWNLKKSEQKIAKEQNVTQANIKYWLIKLNIKRRSIGEALHLLNGNHIDLSSEAIELMEGELLGDGHIQPKNKWSANYTHSSKYEEYLQWLSNQLNTFGIKRIGKIRQYIAKKEKHIGYHYSSVFYSELLTLHHQWYRLYNPETDPPNWRYKYIKIVPRDIKLTPLRCRQWYIGDGNLCPKSSESNSIYLYTMCFPVADIEFLVAKLNELGFESHRTKDNEIYISTKSTPAFLDYIGPCPIDCYKYKWELND